MVFEKEIQFNIENMKDGFYAELHDKELNEFMDLNPGVIVESVYLGRIDINTIKVIITYQ